MIGMFDIIPIVSSPHTGTRSVVKLFDKRKYRKIALDSLTIQGIRNGWGRKVNSEILKLSIDEIFQTIAGPNPSIIISGHFSSHALSIIKRINEYYQIIIPVRDPLLGLISVKSRTNNKKGMFQQLSSWDIWAREIYGLGSFHVPLDLDGYKNLVYREVDFKNIGVYSSETKKDSNLRKAYDNKNLKYLSQELGEGLEALIKLEETLRLPLEELGYKNLLWWS